MKPYKAGASMREIARAVGMTHPGVRSILIRDGVYVPDSRRRVLTHRVNNVPREHI